MPVLGSRFFVTPGPPRLLDHFDIAHPDGGIPAAALVLTPEPQVDQAVADGEVAEREVG